MTNDFKILFGLVLLVTFIQMSHGEVIKMLSKTNQKKTGECPSNMNLASIVTCIPNHECSHDSNCEGALKCCLTSCSRKCVLPEANLKKSSSSVSATRNNLKFKKYSSKNSDKVSSKCPKFNHTLSENECKALNPKSDCETNFDCSFGKKCCFSECGSRKCFKIESSTKLSAKQAFIRPFLDNFYGEGGYYGEGYYGEGYYGEGYGYAYGENNNILRPRVPPTYGSRLNPVLSMPFALAIQQRNPFTRPNQVNQDTLRVNNQLLNRAQSRMPRFNLES